MYLEAEKHIINIIIGAPQNLFRILSQKRVYYMLKNNHIPSPFFKKKYQYRISKKKVVMYLCISVLT